MCSLFALVDLISNFQNCFFAVALFISAEHKGTGVSLVRVEKQVQDAKEESPVPRLSGGVSDSTSASQPENRKIIIVEQVGGAAVLVGFSHSWVMHLSSVYVLVEPRPSTCSQRIAVDLQRSLAIGLMDAY